MTPLQRAGVLGALAFFGVLSADYATSQAPADLSLLYGASIAFATAFFAAFGVTEAYTAGTKAVSAKKAK